MIVLTCDGRLARDPERKEFDGGEFTVFRIGCSYKERGEDKTLWVSCRAFGRVGELIDEYVKQGDQIIVSGRMSTREWRDDEGDKRTDVQVQVDNFSFGAKKRGSDDDGEGY